MIHDYDNKKQNKREMHGKKQHYAFLDILFSLNISSSIIV